MCSKWLKLLPVHSLKFDHLLTQDHHKILLVDPISMFPPSSATALLLLRKISWIFPSHLAGISLHTLSLVSLASWQLTKRRKGNCVVAFLAGGRREQGRGDKVSTPYLGWMYVWAECMYELNVRGGWIWLHRAKCWRTPHRDENSFNQLLRLSCSIHLDVLIISVTTINMCNSMLILSFCSQAQHWCAVCLEVTFSLHLDG